MSPLNPEEPQLEPMTFDEAFNRAAGIAEQATAEDKPRTWRQRLWLAPRGRWRPTRDERQKAIEACRECCRNHLANYGYLPSEVRLQCECRGVVGFDPLTVLWVAVMVTRLLLNLREWWERDRGTTER